MEEKELIVFAAYINVSGLSRSIVEQYLEETRNYFDVEFKDVRLEKNIKVLCIPIHTETRIECIYPFNSGKNVEEDLVKLCRLLLNVDKDKFGSVMDSIEEKINNKK